MKKGMKVADVDSETKKALQWDKVSATMGGDPEFFVADKDGVILNSDRFFPGKHDPIVIPTAEGQDFKKDKVYNKLYFDGIQAEIAPAFSVCRESVMLQINRLLTKAQWVIGKDHSIVLKPAVRVRKSVIEGADPEARIFGCMPDYNAYTLSVNTPPMDAAEHPYRYAGGHIHLGWSSPYLPKGCAEYKMVKDVEMHPRIIKMLDLLVSIPTLPLDNAPGSKMRRDKYGKAGCFRPTPYGVEYRTQSCWWLQSPMTTSLVLGLGRLAWNIMAADRTDFFLSKVGVDEEEIRGTINEGDVKNAAKVWSKMRPYVSTIGASFWNPLYVNAGFTPSVKDVSTFKADPFRNDPPAQFVSGLAFFEYIRANGMDSVLEPGNVAKAWGLSKKAGTDKDLMTSEPAYRGFNTGAYMLTAGKRNDFSKFQKSFWKECVAA